MIIIAKKSVIVIHILFNSVPVTSGAYSGAPSSVFLPLSHLSSTCFLSTYCVSDSVLDARGQQ